MSQIPSAQTTNSETPEILSRPNEARVATPDLDKLRTLVYGVTGTILDGVGRRYAVGSGSRLRICGGFCSGGIGVPSVRAPCPGSSRS
jgi:hypothetical protein